MADLTSVEIKWRSVLGAVGHGVLNDKTSYFKIYKLHI